MILLLFITTQITLSLFMALHDWVEIPPFTHAQALRKQHSWQLILISTLINTLPVLWALYLTCLYYPGPYSLWGNNKFCNYTEPATRSVGSIDGEMFTIVVQAKKI